VKITKFNDDQANHAGARDWREKAFGANVAIIMRNAADNVSKS